MLDSSRIARYTSSMETAAAIGTTVTAWNPAALEVTGTLIALENNIAKVEWVGPTGSCYVGRFTNWK